MIRGVFVTGTDTGVGKTVVAAALMHRYRDQVPGLRYWKPVQTGASEDDDTATVARLAGCREAETLDAGVRLPDPVSPHLAARRSGAPIAIDALVTRLAQEPAGGRWIVEGAGGVLVPLNERDTIVDLIARLALPVVLVARSTLGTINHTTLTIEALRARALPLAGVVAVGPPDRENCEAIVRYGRTRILGQLPPLAELSAGSLRRWAEPELDPAGMLMEAFR
jgi:dethiobiotin synthase